MKRKLFSIAIILALLLGAAGVIAAQATPGSIVDWFVMAAGGGSASGGNITLESTVGQSLVGPAQGGNVSLGAGYWYSQEQVNLYIPLVRR